MAIEQAALIAELAERHSLQAIARALGRDVRWVGRRLNVLKALPEDLLEQVRQGRLSLLGSDSHSRPVGARQLRPCPQLA